MKMGNITRAISTLERKLVTLDASCDRFVRDDNAALSLVALRGWPCLIGWRLRQPLGDLNRLERHASCAVFCCWPALADDASAFASCRACTALLPTESKNDLLVESGAAWGLVGPNVTRLGTNGHISQPMKAVRASGIRVFVNPHANFDQDDGWDTRGSFQALINKIDMFHAHSPTGSMARKS